LSPANDLVTSSLWKLATSDLASLVPCPAVFTAVGQLVERAVHRARKHGELGIASVFGRCKVVGSVAETGSCQCPVRELVHGHLLSHDLVAVQPGQKQQVVGHLARVGNTHPRASAWDGHSQVSNVLIVERCGRSRWEGKAKLCIGSANTSTEVGLPECDALRVLVGREGLSKCQGRTAQQRNGGLHDERK